MRKFITTSFFVAAAFMMTVAPTLAGRSWCRADPIVSFDGTPVQIWIEMPNEYEYLVNGPIEFDITTPSWVESEVLYTDSGFNGYGETVRFHSGVDAWQGSASIVWGSSFQNGNFNWWNAGVIQFEASVPMNTKKLNKHFGIKSTSKIPVRILIVDPQGFEHVVEGTADSTVISFVYQGTN